MAEMEKLNIRIPSAVKQRLDDDAALFEITKENGEINRNEFLNRIIDGYYPQYDENYARLEKNIHSIIGDPSNNLVSFYSYQRMHIFVD